MKQGGGELDQNRFPLGAAQPNRMFVDPVSLGCFQTRQDMARVSCSGVELPNVHVAQDLVRGVAQHLFGGSGEEQDLAL